MPDTRNAEMRSGTLAPPPGLKMLGAEAAGVCADGYCVLPTIGSTSADRAEVQGEADFSSASEDAAGSSAASGSDS